jgi:25S rRNA (uracil2634-N3)-methyltransferase
MKHHNNHTTTPFNLSHADIDTTMKRRSAALHSDSGSDSDGDKSKNASEDLQKGAESPLHRNFHMLYAHASTVRCATEDLCIPCLYKLFPDGAAFGMVLPPNQRPEMCKHSSSVATHTRLEGLYAKKNSMQQPREVLTIGDGDFSFSLSLAQSLQIGNFVATSYESSESVLSVYKHSAQNIQQLRHLGVEVRHVVDGKNIQGSLFESKYRNNFDFIIWNFPCVRATGGADAQVADIPENKDLVRSFFSSARLFLRKQSSAVPSSSGGEIHVTHKTFEPFCWWDIVSLAVEAGLTYRGSVVFDRYLYPGYVNRKALDNKSFPFFDAQVGG